MIFYDKMTKTYSKKEEFDINQDDKNYLKWLSVSDVHMEVGRVFNLPYQVIMFISMKQNQYETSMNPPPLSLQYTPVLLLWPYLVWWEPKLLAADI